MRVVKINYTLISAQDGKILDSTVEKVAKENGFYNKDYKYGPVAIILGEKELLPALEERVKEMKAGEKKEFVLKPEEAFGERKPELIRVIPEKDFKEKNIPLAPGIVVRIGNSFGVIQSINSGRVRVDFNHPLAGKDVKYVVEIVEEVKEPKSILEILKQKLFGSNQPEIKDKKDSLEINSKQGFALEVKKKFAELAKKLLGKKKVVFIEEFS